MLKTTRTSRLLLALPIAALAFGLSGCGSSAGASGRPSAEDISTGLQKIVEEQGISDALNSDIIDCLSEKIAESDISDSDLRTIAQGEDAAISTDTQTALTDIMTSAATECVLQ